MPQQKKINSTVTQITSIKQVEVNDSIFRKKLLKSILILNNLSLYPYPWNLKFTFNAGFIDSQPVYFKPNKKVAKQYSYVYAFSIFLKYKIQCNF